MAETPTPERGIVEALAAIEERLAMLARNTGCPVCAAEWRQHVSTGDGQWVSVTCANGHKWEAVSDA